MRIPCPNCGGIIIGCVMNPITVRCTCKEDIKQLCPECKGSCTPQKPCNVCRNNKMIPYEAGIDHNPDFLNHAEL